jgi:hypothetical protein
MTGRRLLTMARARLFQSLGFLDMGQYARERLNMGASTARRLKWIERHLSDQAEIRVAYYKGEIGLSKVNLLLRVRFTRKAAAWLERAEAVTVRRLEQEVQLVLRRVALVESGLMTLPEGESPYDPLAEGTDLVRSMSALDEIARKGPENAARTSEPTVTVRCAMESDALELWDDCVDRCRELFGKNLQEWECANRFIDSFFEEFNQEDRLRYALNHKVFERDGWQCTVPGCRSRGDLNSHHPEWLSRGGPDTMPNQTATCRRHHLEAIHEGTVEVEGPAPDGLIWRLGVNADGEALLTVGPGERIMKGDPRCDTSPCS